MSHDDQFGRVFSHDIHSVGIDFDTPARGEDPPTAQCLIFVTPDGQRTMNTFLGISTDLDQGEVDPEVIKNSNIVYLEGYLFDRDEAKAAFRQAVEIANKAGRRVALTLSDSFCVERHRDEWLDLIAERVDILFANEHEIHALYGGSFGDCMEQAARWTDIACLTRSAKGSTIVINVF